MRKIHDDIDKMKKYINTRCEEFIPKGLHEKMKNPRSRLEEIKRIMREDELLDDISDDDILVMDNYNHLINQVCCIEEFLQTIND